MFELDLDISRTDTALVLNEQGNWERVAANIAQTTHHNDSLGFHYRGAWTPKQFTNLFRNSEPASDPGQGTTLNLSYVSTPFSSFPFAGGVVLDSSEGTALYYNLASALANGDPVTYFVVAESADGNKPSVGGASTNQIRPVAGTIMANVAVVRERQYGKVWCFTIQGNVSNTSNAYGIQQSDGYTGGVAVTLSGFMVVAGHHMVTELDYVLTAGTSATRSPTAHRGVIPALASLQGYIDVELNPPSVVTRILQIGPDNSNRIMLDISSSNAPYLAWQEGGATQWIIIADTITAGRFRLGFSVQDGYQKFWVDGDPVGDNGGHYNPTGGVVAIGENILGSSNRLTDCGFVQLFMDSWLSENELVSKMQDFSEYGGYSNFKRIE